MAVKRVEHRLKVVTAALDAAGIRYAVVGGNAIAFWVAKADPSATRTTKDVDLLVRQSDLDAITQVLGGIGFERENLRAPVLFLDPDEPSRRSGVHLVWADEKVRPSYAHPAPRVEEAIHAPDGFWVLNRASIVRMQLTSARDIDRVHIGDLLRVGMIDDAVRQSLPSDLMARLRDIEKTIEDDDADLS